MSNDRTCIVIGAAGGVGLALCDILAANGWRLVLSGRSRDRLDQLAGRLASAVQAVEQVDASDFDAVNQLFSRHEGAVGAVNLAGSILLRSAHSTSRSDYDVTMAQNITTAFAVVRAAGKAMRSKGGSVVLMSTCAAQIGLPNHEAISAAKAAVDGLARSAAATYASSGIRFNTVAPGLTDTPMAAKLTASEAARKASEAMHPLGRLGHAQEVARCISFLLAPENAWITGQTLGVDGGLARVKCR